jgi:Nif-specific regulatory protein
VHGIIGNSKALRHAVAEARKAAGSDATVMLIGESGSGKERFARMIHLASERRDQPFVCINCAAIPANLLETELFGHEKGAFTGALAARAGKFETATGGTLFLDEIGDMPLDLQAKLLRVLQERTVQRIGSNSETPVDVRILTATNKQPEEAVKRGDFRLDLFYRLNVIRIVLPPLRERNGDIDLLALYFLARYNQQYRRNLVLDRSALNCLAAYDWPGNVRQIENVIERLVIMSDRDRIGAAEISEVLTAEAAIDVDDITAQSPRAGDTSHPFWSGAGPRPYQKVRHTDKANIMAALRLAKGNKTHAARALGMSARQLQYRLAKLNIAL